MKWMEGKQNRTHKRKYTEICFVYCATCTVFQGSKYSISIHSPIHVPFCRPPGSLEIGSLYPSTTVDYLTIVNYEKDPPNARHPKLLVFISTHTVFPEMDPDSAKREKRGYISLRTHLTQYIEFSLLISRRWLTESTWE